MEINIEKSVFISALQLVTNITSKSTSEPIINNVLIEATNENGNGLLRLSATNYDISIQGVIPAQVKKEGNICVSANRLYTLSREILSDKIHLEATAQNWVFLTGGQSKIKLPGIEAGLFPPITFETLSSQLTLPVKSFKDTIDRTIYAIGENQARKNLMGLNVNIIDENQIRCIGADGFRISQHFLEHKEPIQCTGNIILPKKSLGEIKKVLDYSQSEEVDISFDNSVFQIRGGTIQFKTRLIEADYPDLRNVIYDEGEFSAKIPRAELTNAVRILSMVSDGTKTSSMKITFSEGKMLLESEKQEFGEASNTLFCEYSGETLSIGFNIRYLLESLNSFDASKADYLTVHSKGPYSPFILECDEWKQYKTIVMPMKIKW
ncbi:MAG: DNA polymerase-3 subunit beta [bacterium]|jgi:DNA polymerase-3 subunit beta